MEHAITPIQQYSYTTGKNSSDSAMIIDAMDILYEGNVESFCIVSSDSDFTRLAVRLREAGKYVIGIGEQKTPSAFIASCDKFIYIEIIDLVETESVDSKTKLSVDKKNKASPTHCIFD
ncbi:NYN domain-containing protein [Erysipelothrix sp. Poltava]|nr:NYN domain-containing protein [Erysipelothrix sp. Poltava]